MTYEQTFRHVVAREGCGCPTCYPEGPSARLDDFLRFQAGVQALLGVLNDIGGGNPWNYNVITEAAEDALRAAVEAMGPA